MEKRWLNGRDFLESFKIALAQIFVDDDTDMDIHKMNITCEHLFKEALTIFYEGGEKFAEFVYQKEINFEDKSYLVRLSQGNIRFEIEEDKVLENENPAFDLIEKFNDQTSSYTKITHNIWTITSLYSSTHFWRKDLIYL